MKRGWTRLALGGYRWAGAAVYPFLGTYLAYRAAKGKEELPRKGERYGYASRRRPEGPLVWFHAASVGETNAIVPLIGEVHHRGLAVVLTTGTVTSAAIVRKRLAGQVIHQFVPLDVKRAVSRFLDHWKPDLAIIAESEIWPMTILELGARKTPQVLVNGRMSDRSFRNWRKRPNLAAALFENLSHVAAQSDADAERFLALGAHSVSVSGNLKADVDAPACDSLELARLRAAIGDRKTWAAVCTFDGEERVAANVHAELKATAPDLLTIIVPRHPERSDTIEQILAGKGLTVARRSRGDQVTPATDVLLGDTIGEMGLYLRLVEIVFVGKSLTGEGGQTPLEAAMLRSAILSGRHVGNFREAYKKLVDAGGAKIVRDEAMLSRGVAYLLAHEEARRAMVEAAAAAVEAMRGALPRTITALAPYLNPLTVEARLRAADEFSEARGR